MAATRPASAPEASLGGGAPSAAASTWRSERLASLAAPASAVASRPASAEGRAAPEEGPEDEQPTVTAATSDPMPRVTSRPLRMRTIQDARPRQVKPPPPTAAPPGR